MLPAGEATEATIERLSKILTPGDVVIDGGNTFWQDDLRRAQILKQRGLHYLDVGTSGGVLGREHGYCLMIGGESEIVRRLEPIFAALSPGGDDKTGQASSAAQGWLHVGPNGAGHFVKMVHNGIEYGLMQAYAEGFQILAETDCGRIARSRALQSRYRGDRRSLAPRQHSLVAAAGRDRLGARPRCGAR